MRTPAERLDALLRTGVVALAGEPEPVVSYSNDTWLARSATGEDVVLRVCWIGDRERLVREALVGRHAPSAVGYPPVLDSGRLSADDEELTWMVTRRLSGASLAEAWPDLDQSTQQRALTQLAGRLEALYRWRPPPAVLAHLGPPPPTSDPDTIVGRTLVPLPLGRVRQLLTPAMERAPAYGELIEEAWSWLVRHADLVPALDDPVTGVLLHGDLHLGNVWWDGRQVSGLLDLEWVRLGPAWADLARVRDNAVLVGEDTPEAELDEAHAGLLATLRATVPELAVADLEARLTTLQLAHQLRQILVWGPPGPDPAVDHPVRLLRLLLDLV